MARREDYRKQSEERSRQLRHIHLPTDEEVIRINSGYQDGNLPEPQHKAAETGSIVVSVFIGGALAHQTNDTLLASTFAALLSFLFTQQLIRALRQ